MMTFKSETELKEQIRIHQRLSAASTISLLCGIVSLALFVTFLFYKIYILSIVCFLIFAVFLTVLLLILKFYKKESAEKKHYPYEIILKNELNYEQIKCIMSHSAESGKCRDFQDKSAYFCFINKKFKNRILLTRVECIINFVLIADRLIVPPLYGETDSSDVDRYKKSIQLIKELLN